MNELYMVLTLLFGVATAVLGYLYVNKKSATSEAEIEALAKDRIKAIKEEKQEQLNEYKGEMKQMLKEKEEELQANFSKKSEIELEKLKIELQKEVQKEEKKVRDELYQLQNKLNEKQEHLNEDKQNLETLKGELLDKESDLNDRLASAEAEQQAELEKISKLTKQDAKEMLMKKAESEVGEDLLEFTKKSLERAKDTANIEARDIVSMAIQRCSSEVANEMTQTNVTISSDDDKGKIIGKQGRNIQWLEKTLGVEIIVDEAPGVVTVSGFSSIRRHIAKRTLEKLLADGRVHPSSIEEMHAKAKNEISEDISIAGREATEALGIIDFPDKLVRLLGRLKFRTSYGQNMLKHSMEMARLSGLLAKEINQRFPSREPLDVEICIKGALLHDIGKALDEETQPKGDHVDLGVKVADSFGLDWRIKKCISAHHDESYEDKEKGFCFEAVIVDACDNISGGRPGARKESMEAFYQRMEALENIAEDTPGVSKTWIMRGSRELWVFFDTNEVSATQMHTIVKGIVDRIQTDVKYPGEIKVVGMWEDRFVEYAN